jgi:GTPase SAR1 family protein
MSYVLAVDLGTTFTAAAVMRDAAPQVVSLEHQGTSVPSVLYFAPDRSMLVGTAAVRRVSVDAARVVREFKRRIGDTTPILVGGSPYSAEQLSARLLRWVVDRVTEQEGAPPVGLAVTHPANWGPYKLELLTQLMRIAEVGPSVTITEPEAAAIQYASSERVDVGQVVVVYDLGGGTFDVAILEKTADGFRMLGEPEGIERLGGIDFDAALNGYVIDQLGSALDDVPPDDADWIAALNRLREECTNAKETLSVAPDAVIEAWLPNGRHQVVVTQEAFADMIVPPVTETIKAVRRALQSAHVAPADVARILMVGGSSRVPIVKEMVAEELGIPIALDTHPKHAVALGAARFAAAKTTAFRAELPTSRIAEVAAPVDHVAAAADLDERRSRRDDMRELIDKVMVMADDAGRPDLAARMRQRQQRLEGRSIRVLVAGDFKQGKSTLTNALVQHEVCPADPDFATAVPTAIHHGDRATALVYREIEGSDAEPQADSIEVDQIGRWVSETEGADPERDQVRSCSVTLPVDWMRGGVELVDMPGYGGLDAAAGARIITELRSANAVLFVSDASQELTAPELDFLGTAVKHCPNVTCVLSKTDAYVDWRVIRDINTRHLQRADLDVPIVPVSALLHLTAQRRNRVEHGQESGIDELIRLITTRIASEAEANLIIESSVDVDSTLGQLRGVLAAELEASDPLQQARVVAELQETLGNVQELRLDNSPWHRLLRDGTEDLRIQSTEAFETDMRALVTEAESVIASNDPSVIWEEFQSWLRSRTTTSVGELYSEMTTQVSALERRLLDRLATTEDEVLVMSAGLSSPWIGTLRMEMIDAAIEERASDAAISGSWSAAEPLLGIAGFIPGLGPVSLAVAAVAGLVYGRRALRERKSRALNGRRDQARTHLTEYVDEVQKMVVKSIDRYASHLYRSIRDSVLQRADELERSVSDALRQSKAAGSRSESERAARVTMLRAEIASAGQLDERIGEIRDEAVKRRG